LRLFKFQLNCNHDKLNKDSFLTAQEGGQ